jgi:transcriptional regulator with XRE-family HTH domain
VIKSNYTCYLALLLRIVFPLWQPVMSAGLTPVLPEYILELVATHQRVRPLCICSINATNITPIQPIITPMAEKNSSAESNKLRQVREALHLKQQEFATKLGITQSYLSAVELGKKEITSKLSKKLVELFGISPSWLISNEGSIFNTNNERSGLQTLKHPYLNTLENSHNNLNNPSASPDSDTAEANKIRNTVQTAAIGGEAARRWADRRFMETRIYKRYPGVSSGTLNDYFLTSQLGQYIDQMLVQLHNNLHYRIDQVLDQAIDNELSIEQAADKIQEITKPLSRLQAKLEAMEEMMFDMVKSTVQQYPEMLENVKGTSLYHGMLEWSNRRSKDKDTSKTAA